MGFFDLFCIALTGGMALSGTARDRRWDEERKAKAKKQGCSTYLDHRGARRLVRNNQLVTTTNEPFKYELLNSEHHCTGIYIVDTGFKEWVEKEKRAEKAEMEKRNIAYYEKDTLERFYRGCEWRMKDVERQYQLAHRLWGVPENAPKYSRYWAVPYSPYGVCKKAAGRASWHIHTNFIRPLPNGFHIYDYEEKKFKMFLRNFNREKAENLEPLKATLKYVIDDLEDGKSYLLNLTTEIVTFEAGKYTVDAIAVCEKGSQEELPPDHYLLRKADKSDIEYRNRVRFIRSSDMDFMSVIRESNEWEREQVREKLKWEEVYSREGTQFGLMDWADIIAPRVVPSWENLIE